MASVDVKEDGVIFSMIGVSGKVSFPSGQMRVSGWKLCIALCAVFTEINNTQLHHKT